MARTVDSKKIILIAIILLVGIPAVIPPFFLIWDSFKPVSTGNLFDPSLANFTLQNFVRAYSDPGFIISLGHSLFFAFGSMAVAFVFGGSIAFLVERTNAPLRNVTYGLMFVPIIMPGILTAISWTLLINPKTGILNMAWYALGFTEPLFNAYSVPAMFWVQGLQEAPLTFLLLGAALRAMDPSLEEAAYISGAGKISTMFRITLRLLTPALAGIAILQFVRGLEAFEIPFIMGFKAGIHVFSTNIYYYIRESYPPDYGLGFAFSMTLVVLCVAGLLLYRKVISGSERYATVTGKGYRPRIINLGRLRPVAGAFVVIFVVVTMVLPFLALLWSSFLPFYQVPSKEAIATMSWSNYADIFTRQDFLPMLKNTLTMALIVSIGSMVISTLISWTVIKLKPRGSKILDIIVFLPYAIPAVAIGLAYMIFFLSFPNPIYDTLWIIVFAYLITFLPTGTRFTHAGFAQLRSELEEAATSAGAGILTVLRRVTLPLILPSLIAGTLYIFLLSLRVMSIAALLYTPKSMVLPIYMFQLWTNGNVPAVGAMAVTMIIFSSMVTILTRKLSQRRYVMAEQ